MTEIDVDLLVAGAGAAGSVAALRAAGHGARVLLVDAATRFPESASIGMSAGMIPACGTALQRAAGVDDDVETFAGDIQRKAHGAAPDDVVRALTGRSAALVDWLAGDVGLPLTLVTDFVYPGHSRPRCHAMPSRAGADLHRALLDVVRGESRIDLVHPTRLVDVDGMVAVLETPDGRPETVRAGAVVICAGGFGADRDLRERLLGPAAARLAYHGGEGSHGDAVRLAERHGFDLAYLDSFQGHGSLSLVGVPLTWASVVHGGFLVDGHGRRFGNEQRGYSEYAVLTAAVDGGLAWAVFDADAEEELRRSHDFRVIDSQGAVVRAPDAAALAGRLGLDQDTFAATLEEIARTPDGAVDRFGRTWTRRPSGALRAVRVRGALFHTQGGIRVNRWAQVLRAGEPVPGLYAAGGAAAGISGHGDDGYLAGNGLLAAMGLGFIAADHAMDREVAV